VFVTLILPSATDFINVLCVHFSNKILAPKNYKAKR
jgi:hypothetical protein